MRYCKFGLLLLLFYKSSYAFDWEPDQCANFQIAPQSPIYGHSSLNQSRQLHQGNTGTCYLHVTKQLLEHYHDPKLDFSFNSLLNACPTKPNEGGQVHSILHNMRRLREKVRLYEGNNSKRQMSECNIQDHNGNPLLSSILNQIEGVHDKTIELNKNYVTLDYNFNIHVQQTFKVNPLKLQETVEEILQSTKMPIALTVGDHAVTLVGTAVVCCDQKDCKKRVLIRNSWGKLGSGWYDAERLNLATSQNPSSHFTFMKRCNPTQIDIDGIGGCNSEEIFGEHALEYLVASNDPSAISKLLLKNPQIDLNTTDDMGATPTYTAVDEGHVEALKILAEHGADLNKSDIAGATPAHLAARIGHAEALKILAEHGADLNKSNNNGASPAYIAAQNGDVKVLNILAKYGADLNKSNNNSASPAYIAAQNGDVKVLKILAKYGVDLNKPNRNGATPAFIAASEGHAEALRILAEHGADLNKPKFDRTSPAAIATQNHHPEILKIIEEYNPKGKLRWLRSVFGK